MILKFHIRKKQFIRFFSPAGCLPCCYASCCLPPGLLQFCVRSDLTFYSIFIKEFLVLMVVKQIHPPVSFDPWSAHNFSLKSETIQCSRSHLGPLGGGIMDTYRMVNIFIFRSKKRNYPSTRRAFQRWQTSSICCEKKSRSLTAWHSSRLQIMSFWRSMKSAMRRRM